MFWKLESLKEREALVARFLENQAALKERQVAHKLSRQHQGEFFERALKPVTEATAKAAARTATDIADELGQVREAVNARQDAQSRQYSRAYMMFQEAAGKFSDPDTGSQVAATASLFPIYHIDVSERKGLKNAPADVELRWTLGSPFQFGGANARYNVYCLILSERYLRLEAVNERMDIIV